MKFIIHHLVTSKRTLRLCTAKNYRDSLLDELQAGAQRDGLVILSATMGGDEGEGK